MINKRIIFTCKECGISTTISISGIKRNVTPIVKKLKELLLVCDICYSIRDVQESEE